MVMMAMLFQSSQLDKIQLASGRYVRWQGREVTCCSIRIFHQKRIEFIDVKRFNVTLQRG